MKTNYTVSLASDDSHDRVFAEIFAGDRFIALVSQDEGADRLRIEFPGPGLNESMLLRTVDVVSFKLALDDAVKRLIDG